MSVESANRIHQLNPAAPSNANSAAEGAGHLRVIKTAVRGSFPQFGEGGDSGQFNFGADVLNTLAAGNSPLTFGAGFDGEEWDGTAPLTIDVNFGDSANTVAAGDDPRFLKAVPVELRNSSVTLDGDLADAIVYASSGSPEYTLTNDVPVGTQFQVQNRGSGTISILPGSGNTLHWLAVGAVSTGARNLGEGGVATIVKVAANQFHIYGGGLS